MVNTVEMYADAQLNEFRGPLDVEPREPVDLSKILVTSETVVEKHY